MHLVLKNKMIHKSPNLQGHMLIACFLKNAAYIPFLSLDIIYALRKYPLFKSLEEYS